MMSERRGMIGPYCLLETLGQGGMGIVYRAEQSLTGQEVALKTLRVMDQNLIQSIRREIQVLARIRHPGVIRIIDHGIQAGVPWYAMELLEGAPLRAWRSDIFRSSRSAGGDDSVHTVTGDIIDRDTNEDVLVEDPDQTIVYDYVNKQSCFTKAGPGMARSMLEEKYSAGGIVPMVLPEQSIRAIIGLVRMLCAALSYLHGEGIIHRDLKPDNVLVRADGRPVIVDFGLFAQIGVEVSREVLHIDNRLTGTPHYMAPEQIRGDFVDARADLYALGCIFYELLTSFPPFGPPSSKVGSASQVITDHLYKTPLPISSVISNIPDVLNDVVHRLLEKEPRRRFGYAEDVALALTPLLSDPMDMAHLPASRHYLYRPGFCGREWQFAELEHHLELLQYGQGGLVLLSGESGVGKTRLAMELGRSATHKAIRVIIGECLVERRGPLQALRKPLQIIADLCRSEGEQETQRLFGNRCPVLAVYEPSLLGLPGLVYPEPEVLPPGEAHVRLFSYLTHTFEALVEKNPTMMILDDIQWADDLTIGFLIFLTQLGRLESMPFLVVITCRSEEVPEAKGVETLMSLTGLQRYYLDRLDTQAVSQMISDMLAIEVPDPRFVEFLHNHSEGNPFFIAEYLRAAVEEHVLARDWQGHWHIAEIGSDREFTSAFLPLPHSLRMVVNQRIDRLSPPVRACADIAAIIGRESRTSLLQGLMQGEDGEFLDHLSELFRREVMEEFKPGQLRFVHDKIREVIEEALEPERRKALHRQVALALEQVSFGQESGELARIGSHWEQAGEPTQARNYYLKAARIEVANYAFNRADRMYEKYCALSDTPDQESIGVRLDWVTQCLAHLGKMDLAIKQINLAMDESHHISDPNLEALSYLRMGEIKYLDSEFREARSYYEHALTAFQDRADLIHQAMALERLAILNRYENRLDSARAMYLEAISIYHQSGDYVSEGVTTGNLATLLDVQGQSQEADRLYRQTLELARDAGNELCAMSRF
ncbi:protein kinase [bacterium]|nr:protein kinase [bacterium]